MNKLIILLLITSTSVFAGKWKDAQTPENNGPYIKVVNEKGKPISGAYVYYSQHINEAGIWNCKCRTDSKGMISTGIRVGFKEAISVLKPGYEPTHIIDYIALKGPKVSEGGTKVEPSGEVYTITLKKGKSSMNDLRKVFKQWHKNYYTFIEYMKKHNVNRKPQAGMPVPGVPGVN